MVDTAWRTGADPEETRAAIADPDRLAELRATGLLDSPPEEVFDRITRLAERLLDVPVAMVSLVDRDRQFFKSNVGLEGAWAEDRESPLSSSFCQYAVANRQRLVVTDAPNDPLVRDNGATTEQGVVAYAGDPLETVNGHVVGVFCVIDLRPREWTEEELALLADLTALAVSEIDYRLRARSLSELERLGHALVEPVASLSEAIGSMAGVADRAEDPRVGRLASLARARLSLVEAAASDLASSLHWESEPFRPGSAPVRLGERVMRAVQVATAAVPDRDVKVEIMDRPLLVDCDAYELERTFVNLLVAMMQHAPEHAPVDIHLAREGSSAQLTVSADGRPMPVSELGRIVSHLHAAVCGQDTEAGPGGASLTSAAGATVAEKGPVRGTTGRTGSNLALTIPLMNDQAH